jgi:hypothetical protein
MKKLKLEITLLFVLPSANMGVSECKAKALLVLHEYRGRTFYTESKGLTCVLWYQPRDPRPGIF